MSSDLSSRSAPDPSPSQGHAAVRDLTFRLKHGQTLCLVGESGSGKSLTARALMGLLPETARLGGQVQFDSVPLFEDGITHRGHRFCGHSMGMVFQEPLASLTPSMTVEELVGEAWRCRSGASRATARKRVTEMLVQVGVAQPLPLLEKYPWQLSGGLAQRVLIASALILEPRLLIADEPTTALDVTTQARILELLGRLRDRRGLAMLFITHDLSIASLMGGTVLVLLKGRAVERGPTADVFSHPMHPYTALLVSCTPGLALKEGRTRLAPEVGAESAAAAGAAGAASAAARASAAGTGSSAATGSGCLYVPRCPRRLPLCFTEAPPEFRHGARTVACFNPIRHPGDVEVEP